MFMLNEFVIRFDLVIIAYHFIYLFSLKNRFFIRLWISIIIVELLFLRWPLLLFIGISLQLLLSIILLTIRPKRKYDDYDYIIVLGYVIKNDELNATLKYRLDLAYLAASKYQKAKIILSGGMSLGNTKTEAQIMQEFLCLKSLKEERIIKEDQSKTTIENIKNIKKYLDSKKILLISSDYHLLRALAICHKNGLYPDVCGSKSPLINYSNELLLEKYCLLKLIIKEAN